MQNSGSFTKDDGRMFMQSKEIFTLGPGLTPPLEIKRSAAWIG